MPPTSFPIPTRGTRSNWAELTALPDTPNRSHTSAASLPTRTIALGALGSVLILLGAFGAGGVLVDAPLLGGTPLAALRYGHGKYLAAAVVYLGFGLLTWAWIRLGRGVLAHLVGSRGVLLATAAWIAPLLVSPPLFTRDVYSYLGQGLLALQGLDPYAVGPAALTGPIPANVHPFWQTTPAPYGPLFIGISQVIVLLTGKNVIAGVIAMRLLLLSGLVMFVYALPGLVHHLGGRLPVALWLGAAGPLTVVHLVGGPHNDMLVLGLLAVGCLLSLEGKHPGGIATVTLAMAIKATAGLVLPFLVWMWAARFHGSLGARFTRAVVPALGIFTGVFGACMLLAGVGFGWISALSAPALIISYTSIPTAVGQLVHSVAAAFFDLAPWIFIDTFRALGALVLAGILAWQWWLARDGGPDTVRRASLALLASALLAPTMFPWYLSWSLALAAALPWTRRVLSYLVGASVLLVLGYYPDGEAALYNWPFMVVATALAVLAAMSLRRFDPLGLQEVLRPDLRRVRRR